MSFKTSLSLRSSFLVFLLPFFFIFIFSLTSILYYRWHTETLLHLHDKLSSICVNSAELLNETDLKNYIASKQGSSSLHKKFQTIERQKQIEKIQIISDLRTIEDLLKASKLQSNISKLIHESKPLILGPFSMGKKTLLCAIYPIKDTSFSQDIFIQCDSNYSEFENIKSKMLVFYLISASVSFLLLCFVLFFVAHNITHPIKTIKNAALTIAGGNYEIDVKPSGALEIIELANTLNTMSACLKEKMEQIKQSSMLKEQMYGEKECAALFQERMLENAIDKSPKPLEKMSLYANIPSACYLEIGKDYFCFLQSKQRGFAAMIDLIQDKGKDCPSLRLEIGKDFLNAKVFQMPHPLIWKAKHASLHAFEQTSIEKGDFIIFYSNSLGKIFKSSYIVESLEQVLCHFSNEGARVCLEMLEKKWSFDLKKQNHEEDLHLFCLSC